MLYIVLISLIRVPFCSILHYNFSTSTGVVKKKKAERREIGRLLQTTKIMLKAMDCASPKLHNLVQMLT